MIPCVAPERAGNLTSRLPMPASAEDAFQKAERRIAKALRTGTTDLNLNGLGLEALPEQLGKLTHLKLLHLSDNQLASLPEWLAGLTQLQKLYISSNELTSLPDWLGGLPHLQELALAGNQLTALPEWLEGLDRLQELYLSFNQLTSLPDWLGKLTQLRELDLTFNRLTTLPDWLGRLAQLQKLYLHDNPGLGIPPEVLGPMWQEVNTSEGAVKAANPQAILSYYFAARHADSRPMNEAKLLLVGQGRVGKTSLVRFLVRGQACDTGQLPTEGIWRERWRVKMVPPGGGGTVPVTLNVWDFGGQEIMHATHQFFLTKRSVYLLVLDAGTSEAEGNLFYWLKIIKSFGEEAPVIVVINKSEGAFPLSLNESRLRTDYTNIKGFKYVSCRTGAGIPELKDAITDQVRELPHVFDPVPGPFFAVKREIESWAGQRSFITLPEYQALCTQHGLTNAEAQNRLLRFLHDLGVALNFDDPEDPYELGDTNVLDPAWVTDAVFQVLTSKVLRERDGMLERVDLTGALTDPVRFPASMHGFVLGLMCKFELCFDVPGSSGERFLVPERLPKDEPNVGWLPEQDEGALSFQVRYNVLPPGLVCRFIVKMHTHLTFPPVERPIAPTFWRDGCVLHVHGHRSLVRGSVEERRIYVQVQGPEGTRHEALGLIRERLGEVHRTIKELKADEFVPVPNQPGVAVAHAALVRNARASIDRFIPEGSDEPIEVTELLTRVDTEARRAEYATGSKLGARRGHSTSASSREKVMGGTDSSAGRGISSPVDYGIITMKEEEYRAVERRFTPVEVVSTGRRTYLLSRVPTPQGEKTVLIARCLEQGHSAAQQCANEMLADADPRWLLLVGIAGGFPSEEFTLGDVLLASRVHDFSVTAALEGGVTTFASKGGPVHPAVSKLLAALPAESVGARLGEWNGPSMISMDKPSLTVPKTPTASAFYGSPGWRKKVQEGLLANFPQDGGAPRRPKYRVGSVVSGNALAKDTALAELWKESARQAEHVEMELGGVYAVAHEAQKPVLSVRGLSDVVGFKRSSAWTEFACQTAAAFARALVVSGLIELS